MQNIKKILSDTRTSNHFQEFLIFFWRMWYARMFARYYILSILIICLKSSYSENILYLVFSFRLLQRKCYVLHSGKKSTFLLFPFFLQDTINTSSTIVSDRIHKSIQKPLSFSIFFFVFFDFDRCKVMRVMNDAFAYRDVLSVCLCEGRRKEE
jgi:hypothetical protein